MINIGYTDGNNYYGNDIVGNNIGYTDGVPFVSMANKIYEPFKSYITKIPEFDKKEKICGISYGYFANRGEISSPRGRESQDLMYQLNNNWVCLTVTAYQKTYYSTQIYSDYVRTPSDKDIKFFVRNAHHRNVKVCLKPMLYSEDNIWRAYIGFPESDANDEDVYWKKWFISYKHFILHYAELAQELGVEMLCIGCEMLNTEYRKYDWEYIIKEIKRVYSGKLIYSAHHEHNIAVDWTDSLDYLGVSAYYSMEETNCNKMKNKWKIIKDELDKIAKEKNKQFIFMEIGCRSTEGAAAQPWNFNKKSKWSEEEQYNYYKSCMDTFMDDPYFAGVFWWNWPTVQYNTRKAAENDKDFNIHLKAAEELVKDTYRRMNNGRNPV